MELKDDENQNLILQMILSQSSTAPEIIKKTGFSRPTIDLILSQLVKKQVVRKKGVGRSSGGRRPVVYSINESGRFAIGVAVAIPKISGVVVDLSGNVLASESISIPIWSQADYFISEVAALIERLIKTLPQKSRFEGIGLAIPGLVDPQNGVSTFFSRLSTFYNTPVKAMLEDRLKEKVSVSRYLGSAAYSSVFTKQIEARKPIIYIELGEGIEMALFNDGKPYRGNILNEGGFGHMVIDFGGRTCLCGGSGCLEAYAANRVMIDEAVLRVRNGEKSAIPTDKNINDDEFYGFVRAGDHVAVSVAEKGMDYLSIGISNLINLLNPATIIISGAIANAGEAFLDKIRKRINHYALKLLTDKLEIRFTLFDLKEGARGVGLLRLYEELRLINNH